MRASVPFVLILAVIALCAGLPSAVQAGSLDADIEKAMRDGHVPGLTLAVVRKDEVVLTKGYGVRKRGEPAKVDARTLFAIGSTSKAFAAATVALLIDDNTLRWDDHVRQILPWLEVREPHVSDQITVRDLLAHRIGTSYQDEGRLRRYSRDARDLLERGRWIDPVASFRSRYVYSNNMFIAAGQVVATISDSSWPEFARQRLFVPLNMASTGADSRVARSQPNSATPHRGAEGSDPQPIAWEYPDAVAVPSGGVNSNAVDMAQWLRFQLGEGEIGGQRLISREVFRQMHLPQTAITDPEAAPDIESQYPAAVRAAARMRFWSYGLGWYVTEYRGRKFLYHSGSIQGFRTGVGLLPEEGLAVYVGVNRTPSRLPMAMLLRVFDEYLDTPRTDWTAVYLE